MKKLFLLSYFFCITSVSAQGFLGERIEYGNAHLGNNFEPTESHLKRSEELKAEFSTENKILLNKIRKTSTFSTACSELVMMCLIDGNLYCRGKMLDNILNKCLPAVAALEPHFDKTIKEVPQELLKKDPMCAEWNLNCQHCKHLFNRWHCGRLQCVPQEGKAEPKCVKQKDTEAPNSKIINTRSDTIFRVEYRDEALPIPIGEDLTPIPPYCNNWKGACYNCENNRSIKKFDCRLKNKCSALATEHCTQYEYPQNLKPSLLESYSVWEEDCLRCIDNRKGSVKCEVKDLDAVCTRSPEFTNSDFVKTLVRSLEAEKLPLPKPSVKRKPINDRVYQPPKAMSLEEAKISNCRIFDTGCGTCAINPEGTECDHGNIFRQCFMRTFSQCIEFYEAFTVEGKRNELLDLKSRWEALKIENCSQTDLQCKEYEARDIWREDVKNCGENDETWCPLVNADCVASARENCSRNYDKELYAAISQEHKDRIEMLDWTEDVYFLREGLDGALRYKFKKLETLEKNEAWMKANSHRQKCCMADKYADTKGMMEYVYSGIETEEDNEVELKKQPNEPLNKDAKQKTTKPILEVAEKPTLWGLLKYHLGID